MYKLWTKTEQPEMMDVFLGELTAAVNRFNRIKRERITPNSDNLMVLLGDKDLPSPYLVFADLISGSKAKKNQDIFEEMKKFAFIKEKSGKVEMFGRILVALYRTYILRNMKGLRDQGAQVASTLEEMLALMAIEGFETHLFHATRHWIADWKREGFSKELAFKIKNLK